MGQANIKFGGGVSETIVNPAVLLAILVAGVLICVLPRNKAIFPFLAAGMLIPMDQILLIGPAHFPMLRVLVLFGFVRILRDKASSKVLMFSGGKNQLDKAFILLAVTIAVSGILLFQEMGAVIYQLGTLYTALGVYLLARYLIRSDEDVVRVIQTLAYVALVVAAIMVYESRSGHNPYALLGGAQASTLANLAERDGRFRAQGPFAHSILAGTFGAVIAPLFVALWCKGRKYRLLSGAGILSAMIMIVTCDSSTPVLAFGAGVIAFCLWPIRNWMRAVRWGIVVTLVALHMVMHGPVWSLIEKIDISGGSSSYHRYMLVDQCIRHFSDWWLVGVKDTSIWGWDMWDTANQYVGTCDGSGLLAFILFIAVLVYAFKYVGKARRAAGRDKERALFIWAIGAALFANVIAFVGISYFDQSIVPWYALLAIICAVVAVPAKTKPKSPELKAPSEESQEVSQLVSTGPSISTALEAAI